MLKACLNMKENKYLIKTINNRFIRICIIIIIKIRRFVNLFNFIKIFFKTNYFNYSFFFILFRIFKIINYLTYIINYFLFFLYYYKFKIKYFLL